MVELFGKKEKRKTNTRLPNHLTATHRHIYTNHVNLFKKYSPNRTHKHWVTYWPLIHADQNRLYDWHAVSSVFVNGQFNTHCIREIMFPFVSKWKIQRACARVCVCVCVYVREYLWMCWVKTNVDQYYFATKLLLQRLTKMNFTNLCCANIFVRDKLQWHDIRQEWF